MDIHNIIKAEVPDLKPVDAITSILGMSKSGAYKKLSGDSKFSLDEIIKIFQELNISFDKYFLSDDAQFKTYSFSTDTIKYKPRSYSEYWNQIKSNLEHLVTDPSASAIYFANEIPFFYYLQFPKMLAFKLFVWDKTNWNIHQDLDQFSFGIINNIPELNEITQRILKIYLSYPSIELWNPDMLRLSMMQLSYYVKAGVFQSAEQIREIISDMDKMLIFMKRCCDSGKKSFFGKEDSNNDIEIYLNELVVNSEIIYTSSNNYTAIYNKYDTPNYMLSDDKRVCDHICDWLEKIISKSTLISTRGKRDRDMFFKNAFEDLDIFQERMEGMIKTYFK